MAPSATGLLVIRVWLEEASVQPLRAHLRWTSDVSVGLQQSLTVADVDAVCELVRDWLGSMLADRDTAIP
jgi:hypothetical protein